MDKSGGWIDLCGILDSIFSHYEAYPKSFKVAALSNNGLTPPGSSPGLEFVFDEEIQVRAWPQLVYGQENRFVNGKMNPYHLLGSGYHIQVRGVDLQDSDNNGRPRLTKPRLTYGQELLTRTIMLPNYSSSHTEFAEMQRIRRSESRIQVLYTNTFGKGMFGAQDDDGDRITVAALSGYLHRIMAQLEPHFEKSLTLDLE